MAGRLKQFLFVGQTGQMDSDQIKGYYGRSVKLENCMHPYLSLEDITKSLCQHSTFTDSVRLRVNYHLLMNILHAVKLGTE